jgi:hypothetical protein
MTLREIIAMAAGRIVMLRRQMSLRPGTAVPGRLRCPGRVRGLALGHQVPAGRPGLVKLLWLAIINIEGKRVTGWREGLNELDNAYPGRLR